MTETKPTKKRRFPLALKLNLVTVCMILLTAAALLGVSYVVQDQRIREAYYRDAEVTARRGAEMMPGYMITFFRELAENPEFQEVRAKAEAAGDENILIDWMKNKPGFYYVGTDISETSFGSELPEDRHEILSLYGDFQDLTRILAIASDGSSTVDTYVQYMKDGVTYNLIDEELGVMAIGTVEEQLPEFAGYGDNERVPAVVYHNGTDWLCSAYEPILRDGQAVALAGVDIDMNQVVRSSYEFLFRCIAFVLILIVIFILINLWLIRRIAIQPLKTLTEGATAFGEDESSYTREAVIKAEIKSNDEIEDLYQAIRRMQTRIVDYTEDLTKLTEEKTRNAAEMSLAGEIQSAMLLKVFPDNPEFSMSAAMDPAREVGGDFYDFFKTDDDHMAIVIADVSGKGIPAALFMMSVMILIRTRMQTGRTPSEILAAVNNQICENNSVKMFVTVWMGILNISTGEMICANAGHEYPMLSRKGQPWEMIKDKHGFVVGGMEDIQYTDYTMQLLPGDRLFLYTDGLPETENTEKAFLGTERILTHLNTLGDAGPEEILKRERADADEFAAGAEQHDDLTMLCLQYNGKN